MVYLTLPLPGGWDAYDLYCMPTINVYLVHTFLSAINRSSRANISQILYLHDLQYSTVVQVAEWKTPNQYKYDLHSSRTYFVGRTCFMQIDLAQHLVTAGYGPVDLLLYIR